MAAAFPSARRLTRPFGRVAGRQRARFAGPAGDRSIGAGTGNVARPCAHDPTTRLMAGRCAIGMVLLDRGAAADGPHKQLVGALPGARSPRPTRSASSRSRSTPTRRTTRCEGVGRGRRGRCRRPRRVPRAPGAPRALAPPRQGAGVSGPPLTVAFLGTGVMGAPMARNIARAGPDRPGLEPHDRARPPARGSTARPSASEPAHAVDGADVVVTMLSDAGPTLEVAEAVAARARPRTRSGRRWARSGSRATERCIDLARSHGRRVRRRARSSARSSPREDGKLTVLASGPDDAIERCSPVFRAVGHKTLRVGRGRAGHAAEARGQRLGARPDAGHRRGGRAREGPRPRRRPDARGARRARPTDAPYFRMKSALMDAGEYPVSFTLRLAAKDAALMEEAADAAGRRRRR